jgi:hypothetical protein
MVFEGILLMNCDNGQMRVTVRNPLAHIGFSFDTRKRSRFFISKVLRDRRRAMMLLRSFRLFVGA